MASYHDKGAMSKERNFEKDAVIFLYKSHGLDQIIEDCRSYSGKGRQALYHFDVYVDVPMLMEENVQLCNLLLNKPFVCAELFKEVIYKAITTFKWLENIVEKNQLLVTVRITQLPPFPDQRASYTCPNSECTASVLKCVVFHEPGWKEFQIVRNDFKCDCCGGPMKEIVAERVLEEKIIAKVVPLGGCHQLFTTSVLFHSIPIYFRGTLAHKVKLGRAYSIIALLGCKQSALIKKTYLEANFMTDYNDNFKRSCSSFLEIVYDKLKQFVVQLRLHDTFVQSYVLPLIISYYFGEHIVDRGLYFKLKFGILLALMTCKNASQCNEKANMSLLVIGSDTAIINRLLTYGIKFAPRATSLIDHCQLKVGLSVWSDSNLSGLPSVEGNPLLLATGGVCYLGEISKFDNPAKITIANILKTGLVSLDVVKDNNYLGIVEALPKSFCTDCQVWAYSSELKQQKNFQISFTNSQTVNLSKHLLDAFSVIYYTDSWSENETSKKDEKVMEQVLEDNISKENYNYHSIFTHEEFVKLLRLLQHQNVHFEAAAENLIQSYFVASRSIHSSDTQDTGLSVTALKTLSLMAEGHAKLSFRSAVTEADAIAVILLYEEYLTSRYGISYLNLQPLPHLLKGSVLEDFKLLYDWYETFSSNLKKHLSLYQSYAADKPEE